ncbi:GspE/PulE family protein [Leptolyngbya sp. 15MV]|nr:GspE/PulE family protein [Leptolyngbya sp. 15MV]
MAPNAGKTQLSLDQVGMSPQMQERFVSLVERPNGIILVTGPTGSGKTTTLYAALAKVDRNTSNVMTVEDPVEYRLEGISQMQVNPKRGVTFATGLRSLLRQDPDVILIGEIRDKETAELAIQASLTGHLVLATLHTNDAPTAIPRLIDIGVAPYLVTSSLLAVVAQRLLRRTCKTCNGTAKTTADTRCEECGGTGYRGRIAVYELMMMTDELRRLAGQNTDAVSLRDAAVAQGFEPMIEDAKRKVAAGLTTMEEVRRVLA